MAERKGSKKPESLNDSHYRLLQHLLSPPPAAANPSSTPAGIINPNKHFTLFPP